MAIFKIIITTNEDWERHYEIEAKNIDEARAMAEQEIKEQKKAYKNNVTILSIVTGTL